LRQRKVQRGGKIEMCFLFDLVGLEDWRYARHTRKLYPTFRTMMVMLRQTCLIAKDCLLSASYCLLNLF